jgi:hypothetical protein
MGNRAHCGMSCEPQCRFFGPYAIRHAVIGSLIDSLDSSAQDFAWADVATDWPDR